LAQGNKLSYQQIRELNTLRKKDYIAQILKEDDEGRQYIKNIESKVIDKHDEVTKLIWEIEDLNSDWKNAVDSINAAIKKRAIEIGIDKDAMKKFKF
jgi:hypothetical protein